MAQQVKPYIVGVDVSKDKLDVYEQWSERSFEVVNKGEAIEEWLSGYEVEIQLVVEPTSIYHREVCEQAHGGGHAVYLVDPYRLNHYRESVGVRAKVDRGDARLLARYMNNEGGEIRRWSPLGAREKRVWQLLKRRATLVEARTQLRQSLGDVDIEAEQIGALLKEFDRTVRCLERAMRAQVKALGWLSLVIRCEAIPGVGPLTATAMVATYHRGDFCSVDAFVAFIGMDVRVRESGKFKGRRKLTKKGDSEVRRLLYNAAMAARRSALWEPFYLSHTKRGKEPTEALVALGRKLARVCFALMRKNVEFDPKFCPGG